MAYGFNEDKSKIEVLPTSGGELDGTLYLNENAWVTKRTPLDTTVAPESSTTVNSYQVQDANGIFIGQLRSIHYDDGSVGFYLVTRQGTGGGIKQGSLGPRISPDGQVSYIVSNPPAFREAINALNKSSDTMSGILYLQSNNIDREDNGPGAQTFGNALCFTDKDGERLATIYVAREINGEQRISIASLNENLSHEERTNLISIIVAKDGSRSYAVSNPAGFRDAIYAAGEAAGQDACFQKYLGTSHIWGLTANCTNNNNIEAYNLRHTLLVENNGLALYHNSSDEFDWRYDAINRPITTTISNIITAAANHTITEAKCVERNGIAQLRIFFKTSSTATGSHTIGTLVNDKKPSDLVYGSKHSSIVSGCSIAANGTVTVDFSSAPNTSTVYGVTFMYLKA